ncbi:MAG: M67 family metallopeptidase [Anaerolineae bacterium]|nr:M67 family metallopeptidase [Anaerolineae bacterium]MDQ7035089.1 M67 family metallopeptidase [Anaerolineae bacterium]
MRFLRLSYQQVQIIVGQAQSGLPDEICGLIVGQKGIAQQIISIPNRSETPETHFDMDAKALLQAYKKMDAVGGELLAVYHSHPKSDPIPSQTDIREAMRNMPNVTQLIISLKQQKARLQAWHIHDGRVDKVELLVGNEKSRSMQSLSRAQVIAILVMTFLAVAFLISLSISLLPPAPPIPTPQ